jgi:hypothetical protein
MRCLNQRGEALASTVRNNQSIMLSPETNLPFYAGLKLLKVTARLKEVINQSIMAL